MKRLFRSASLAPEGWIGFDPGKFTDQPTAPGAGHKDKNPAWRRAWIKRAEARHGKLYVKLCALVVYHRLRHNIRGDQVMAAWFQIGAELWTPFEDLAADRRRFRRLRLLYSEFMREAARELAEMAGAVAGDLKGMVDSMNAWRPPDASNWMPAEIKNVTMNGRPVMINPDRISFTVRLDDGSEVKL